MYQLFTEVKKVVKKNIKIKNQKKIYLEIYMNKKVKMAELYPKMIKKNLNNIKN